jgi:uncharacterized protein
MKTIKLLFIINLFLGTAYAQYQEDYFIRVKQLVDKYHNRKDPVKKIVEVIKKEQWDPFTTNSIGANILLYYAAEPTTTKTRDNLGRQVCSNVNEEEASLIIQTQQELGLSLNSLGKAGVSPLHLAVTSNCLDLVKILVKHGANIELPTQEKKQTPLMMAASNINYDIMEFLLSSGANPNAVDISNLSAFSYLVVGTNKNVTDVTSDLSDDGYDMNFILNKRANEDEIFQKCFQLLLDYKGELDPKGTISLTPLMAAINVDNRKIVETYIENTKDIDLQNHYGNTALHYAVKDNKPWFINDILQKSKAQTIKNNKGQTPFELAIALGKYDAIDKFFEYSYFYYAYLSITKGQTEVLTSYLSRQRDIKSIINKSRDDVTTLILAVENNKFNLVKFLVSNGANVNWQNEKYGLSALAIAIKNNYFAIAKYLILHGSNLYLTDNDGFTVFDYTVDNIKIKDLLDKFKGRNADEVIKELLINEG